MGKYAYLDVQGLLRIVDNEVDAKEYAKHNGKVVETALEAKGGVPAIFSKKTRVMEEVFVDDIGKAYFDNRGTDEAKLAAYPELLDVFVLYRKLM